MAAIDLPLPKVGLVQSAAPYPLRLILNWGRRYSLWVFNFGLACCAIEFIAASMGRHDFIRLGVIPFAHGPRQADLMIVSGTVTDKMAPAVRRLWEQMPEPKYVISFGACSNSGGPYWDSYCVTKGVDQIIPVDVYVPGCPPRPEALLQGIVKLQEKIAGEHLGRRYAEARREVSAAAVTRGLVLPPVRIPQAGEPMPLIPSPTDALAAEPETQNPYMELPPVEETVVDEDAPPVQRPGRLDFGLAPLEQETSWPAVLRETGDAGAWPDLPAEPLPEPEPQPLVPPDFVAEPAVDSVVERLAPPDFVAGPEAEPVGESSVEPLMPPDFVAGPEAEPVGESSVEPLMPPDFSAEPEIEPSAEPVEEPRALPDYLVEPESQPLTPLAEPEPGLQPEPVLEPGPELESWADLLAPPTAHEPVADDSAPDEGALDDQATDDSASDDSAPDGPAPDDSAPDGPTRGRHA